MQIQNPLSILSRVKPEHLFLDPYPHLVVEDALPSETFDLLFEAFPPDDLVVDGRPVKDTWYDYPACKVVKDMRVSALWREFFAFHTSPAFFQELVQMFGPTLRLLHPDLEARVGRPMEASAIAASRALMRAALLSR